MEIPWRTQSSVTHPAERRRHFSLWGWAVFMVLVCAGCGSRESAVQSPLRRYGLDIVAPVQEAGSDWRSWRFQRSLLPELIVFGSEHLNIQAIEQSFSQVKLDPSKLRLVEPARVRVYFISEASGYRDTLGVNLEGVGIQDGNPRLVFPDATADRDLYQTAALIDRKTIKLDESQLAERSDAAPLRPGDFVDLGKLPAGSQLSFFLINDKEEVFSVEPSANPDGVTHAVAFAIEDTPYLLVSFEDLLHGGDRDYSDCVFMVELSVGNVEALVGKIDPWRRVREMLFLAGLLALVVGVPGGVLYLRRRARLARDGRARQRVKALLDAEDPQAALEIIRSRPQRFTESRAAWQELELSALEQLEDYAGLIDFEAKAPEFLAQHEPSSLKVARSFVETEDWEEFNRMRESWRSRESNPGEWLALDADVLVAQDQSAAARTLLQEGIDEKRRNCAPLLRLALLTAPSDPEAALNLLKRAQAIAPARPEIQVFRAQVLEHMGDYDSARASYAKAMELAPGDPFVRDHCAEFYRRRGDYPRALQIWSGGLAPPTMGFLWLKTAFWTKVAYPLQIEWPATSSLSGALLPLVEYVRGLPAGRFWDAPRFAPIAEVHPSLGTRQEAFWLRLIEALRIRREDEALSLLNLHRFGKRSWHASLEIALLHIVTYRRLGFLDPRIGVAETESPTRHTFFAHLDAWAKDQTSPVSSETERLVRGEEAFAAAFLVAGWDEAALQLRRVPLSTSEYPRWYIDLLAGAERRNRGTTAEREFWETLGP